MTCLTGVLLGAASQSPSAGDDTGYRSPNPPLNEQEWVHPVIFETQNKIHLNISSHKLTSFVDFAPFLAGFQRVRDYLTKFKRDLNTHSHPFQDSQYRSSSIKTSIIANKTVLMNYLKKHWYQHDPYSCNTKIKVN